MGNRLGPVAIMLLAAGAAFAHQGVKDPQVMARMDAMARIGAATKVLGEMAKGASPFDAEKAQAAARRIAEEAAQVPALFQPPATDPKSEALPAIWEQFDTFAELTRDMQEAALGATGIAEPDDLRPALRSLGATCTACHEDFRE